MLLVLDVGSSSVRCTAFRRPSPGGTCRACRRVRPPSVIKSPAPAPCALPHGRFDVEALSSAATAAVDECLAVLSRVAGPVPEITGIGVSCFAMSLVGTSASGAPLTPCFSYAERAEDTRRVHTPCLRDRVTRKYPGGLAAAYNCTGAPIHSAYAGPTLLRFATAAPARSPMSSAGNRLLRISCRAGVTDLGSRFVLGCLMDGLAEPSYS